MPVLNDEVPDDDDFDSGRKRGEFDHITPDDFLRAGRGKNPPGWLSNSYIEDVRHHVPLPYVVVLPVRTDSFGRISHVATVLTASDEDGAITRTLIAGRILFHETIREAIVRNISKDMGEVTLPHLPVNMQPFSVAEFFPTPGLSPYYDSRQHAVALCYIVEIVGECRASDETLDVEWVTPQEALSADFLKQLSHGYDRIMQQGLHIAGF